MAGLDALRPGESGIVRSVGGTGALRRRLLDMGITPGTRVSVRKVAPLGDPIELCLRGYELSIRKADARNIEVECERGAVV
jgi:ferrous iron transport protein A